MASTDASAYPIKNAAWRVTFPIFDADGDLVTGATGLDSEVSKDGGTFADCTNEATEIATSSGIYYLDLTSTEMNADTVAIIVKTTTVGAKTTAIVTYPITTSTAKLGVNLVNIAGAAVSTSTAQLGVNVVNFGGSAGTFASGIPAVNATQWGGTAVGSATVRSDLINIAGAAVNTASAQLGVNVVNFGGSAGTFASGRPEVNTTHWAGNATSAANLAVVSRATAGTAQAGGASTITLAAGASATNDIFIYSNIYLTGGTGAGQTGTIKDYNGTTKVATIFGAWGVTPDNTTTYTVIPGGYAADIADITAGLATSAEVAAVQSTADAILTDTGTTIPGTITTLQATADAIETDTQDIQTRLPAALVSGRIDASVGAMAAGVLTASALAADAVDEIWDEVMEGTTTARQSMRLANSANGAKLSGAATTTVAIRDLADSKDRVTATVTADGDRTAVTLDLT